MMSLIKLPSIRLFIICSILSVNFLHATMDPTWDTRHDVFAIHSIPKCGTHFLQKVVSLMVSKSIKNSPLSVESIYRVALEDHILRGSQPYDGQNLKNILKAGYKVVAIVRDPRDALISHLFYMRTFAGKGNKRDFFRVGNLFDEQPIDNQLTSLIIGNNHAPSYLEFYRNRIGWSLADGVLRVRYEDLVGSDEVREKTVKKIAKYINLNLTEDHLQYVLKNMVAPQREEQQGDKIFVRSSTENWKTFLSPKQKELIKKHYGKLLIQLGYEKDLKW